MRVRFWKRMPRRDHDWVRERMSDYVDGDLAREDRADVEEHVGMCPGCRRILNTLRSTLRQLAALSEEPEPSVADAVIQRLRRSG